jgi:ferritin-like metal-binding protein YciE
VRALPKLAKAATAPDLKQVLTSHLEETEGQVTRLERIAEFVGKKLTGKSCAGMKGVLEEGSEVLEERVQTPQTRNARRVRQASSP